MLSDTVRDYLKHRWIARLSTIDPDGYPHTVPLWYDVDGDDLVIISERSTRKVKNAIADPKGAVSVGGDVDDDGDVQTGYLFQGTFTIVDDADHDWTKRMTRRYEPPERAEKSIAEWSTLDMVVMRLTIAKVIKVS